MKIRPEFLPVSGQIGIPWMPDRGMALRNSGALTQVATAPCQFLAALYAGFSVVAFTVARIDVQKKRAAMRPVHVLLMIQLPLLANLDLEVVDIDAVWSWCDRSAVAQGAELHLNTVA